MRDMALKWFPLILCLLVGPAQAQFCICQTASNVISGWQVAHIGAGGFSTGVDIECDQGFGQCNNSGTTTKVVRTDTYGAYIWNSTNAAWQQLLTSTAMPNGDPMNAIGACLNTSSSGCGIYEIRVAPSNTSVLYMVLNGYVYKGTNNCTVANPCVTWAATNFTQENAYNANDRWWGPKLAIDPANPNNVIFCSEGSGCQQSSNGGATASAITGLTNAASNGMLVVFDPSTTSGGSTPGIYISSYGHGVYHTTGGLTGIWTLTTGTPTTHQFMTITAAGVLYLVGNAGGNDQTLHILSSGTWSSVTVGTSTDGQITGVAINPANASDVVAVNQGGQLTYSTNGGTSFGGYLANNQITLAATDIPWLTHTSNSFVDISQIMFDPAQSNFLFLTSGFNVWTTSGYTGGSTVTYTSQGAGLEQLVSTWAISPWTSGSYPLFSVRDQQIFYMSSIGTNNYPTFAQHGGSGGFTDVVASTSADWAASVPADVLCVCDSVIGQGDFSSYSTNLGSSWTALNAVPSGQGSSFLGGMVAYGSSGTTAVWIPYNGPLNEGTKSGSNWTWTAPSISGVPATAPYGWGTSYQTFRQIVVADRVSADTFYAYNYGGNGGTAGIYKGVYSAGSWTWALALSGAFDGGAQSEFYAQMRSVPGNAGEFMYSSGLNTPGPYPHAQSFYDCQDTNGTVNCSGYANIREIWAFGFGAAKPGGSGFPEIYIWGWANCGASHSVIQNCPAGAGGYTGGIWRSPDHGSTWFYLGVPNNSLDTIDTVEGDGNIYGRVYVGNNGSGYAWGQFN